MKKLNLGLFFLLMILLTSIPIVTASTQGIVNPFIHGMTSSTIQTINSGSVDVSNSAFRDVPSVGFLVIVLSQATNVKPQAIEFFPIAAFALVLAAFALGRRFGHTWITTLLITSIIIFIWLPPTLYTIWPHTFGFALYMIFISMYFHLKSGKRWEVVILLFLIFLGIHFFSYTVELWTISFVAFVSLVSFLRGRRGQMSVLMLLLSFIVISLASTEIIYRSYIPKLEYASQSIDIGVNSMISTILRTQPPVPYAWVPPELPWYLLVLNLSYYVLILLPLLLVVYRGFARRAGNQFSRQTVEKHPFESLLIAAFILVWSVDFASYALLGAVSIGLLRYGTLALPFLSVWFLTRFLSDSHHKSSRISKHSSITSYILIVFTISCLIFTATSNQPNYVTSHSKYSEVHPSGEWFLGHMSTASYIFSDFHTQGQYMILAGDMGRPFRATNYYNSSSFGLLVETNPTVPNKTLFQNQYVVVNIALSDKKTIVDTWIDFEPLEPHLPAIKQNPNLHMIYNDGIVWILKGK